MAIMRMSACRRMRATRAMLVPPWMSQEPQVRRRLWGCQSVIWPLALVVVKEDVGKIWLHLGC